MKNGLQSETGRSFGDMMPAERAGGFHSKLQSLLYRVYDLTILPLRFDERSYLALYPDVGAGIASGQYRSAIEHYRRVGRSQHMDYLSAWKEKRPRVNDVPVVLFLFNRPSATAAVFAEIRKFAPSTLLLVADGPRDETEAQQCAEARAVAEQVDWPCKVLRHFSPSNLGCKERISSGLEWVFQQVEEAIILEDDCLPDPSFFPFCSHLLYAYRDDHRVMHISGSCFLARPCTKCSYWVSRHSDIWGWATWRRAFRHYDAQMASWPWCGPLQRLLLWKNPLEREWWKTFLDYTYSGEINTWDFQWHWTVYRRRGLAIVPRSNLITNIGHGLFATHTRLLSSPAANLATKPVWDMKHPRRLRREPRADFESFLVRHFLGDLAHREVMLPAFNRPTEVVVTHRSPICRDVGALVHNVIEESRPWVSLYSTHTPNQFKAAFPSLLIEGFAGRASRALTVSTLARALGDSSISRVFCFPEHEQDCLTALCLSETYHAPLCLWLTEDRNIQGTGISDALMRELIEKSAVRLAICEEMRAAYEEKFGMPFEVRKPLEF